MGLKSIIWKEAIIIRRIKTFLCWFKLRTGTIVTWFFSLLGSIGLLIFFIRRMVEYFSPSGIQCPTQGIPTDIQCLLFHGRVSFFSVVYIIFLILQSVFITSFGFYSWFRNFDLRSLEIFFYVIFIIFFLDYINSLILIIVTDGGVLVIIPTMTYKAIVSIYFLWVIYSHVLETDEKYRHERESDIATHKLSSDLEVSRSQSEAETEGENPDLRRRICDESKINTSSLGESNW